MREIIEILVSVEAILIYAILNRTVSMWVEHMYFKFGSMFKSHTGYKIFLTLDLTWACGNEFQFQRITPRSYVNISISYESSYPPSPY